MFYVGDPRDSELHKSVSCNRWWEKNGFEIDCIFLNEMKLKSLIYTLALLLLKNSLEFEFREGMFVFR